MPRQRTELLTSECDVVGIATDLAHLLKRVDNTDIKYEFPGSFTRYTSGHEQAMLNIRSNIAASAVGIRQSIIMYSDETVVGTGIVTTSDTTPDGIDATWPNVSGFICNPYRRQGLGRLSLLSRLALVESQFGGNAWTIVKAGNEASRHLVSQCGFTPVQELLDKTVYTYTAK